MKKIIQFGEVAEDYDIQKTAVSQLLVVMGVIAFIILMVYQLHDFYSVAPYDMFGIDSSK